MDASTHPTGSNPPLEVIRHDPAYAMFLTDKGKICREKTKIPRPADAADTSVPIVTWNGVRINPPKDQYRTPEETNAHTAWRKAVAEFERDNAKRKRDARVHQEASEEAKKRKVDNQREARREQREEDRKLCVWIVYPPVTYTAQDPETGCNVTVKKARFGPQNEEDADGLNRQLAHEDTCRAIAAAQAWDKYAKPRGFTIYPRNDDDEETQSDIGVEHTEDTDGNVEILETEFAEPIQNTSVTPEFAAWVEEHSEFNKYKYEEHYFRKQHWNVTCLEGPQDVNVVLKLKEPVNKTTLGEMFRAMEIGKDTDDREDYYQNPQVSVAKDPFVFCRYLAFGYCNDGHKTHEDCDKTPLFGGADIDIEDKWLETWLLYEIEWAGARAIADLHPTDRNEDGSRNAGRTWFTSIKCRCKATVRKFDHLRDAVLVPKAASAEASTHDIRYKKIMRLADAVDNDDEGLQRLYDILAWHLVDPAALQKKLLRHLTCDRNAEGADWAKRHLCFTGPSGSGKTSLTGPLVGSERQRESLLVSAMLPEAHGLTKWAHMQCPGDTDILVTPELAKALGADSGSKAQSLTPSELIALFDDPEKFKPAHAAWRIRTKLPVLCNTQKRPTVGDDKASIYNRLDIIKLNGGELPSITCKGKWFVSAAAMSRFLKYPVEMTMPTWFKTVAKRMHKLQKLRDQQLQSVYHGSEASMSRAAAEIHEKYRRAAAPMHRELRPSLYVTDETQPPLEDTDMVFDSDDDEPDFTDLP
jgi:hypothetical protein